MTISRTPPFVSVDRYSTRNQSNSDNEDNATECAPLTEVNLLLPASDDHPTEDNAQVITDLIVTVN